MKRIDLFVGVLDAIKVLSVILVITGCVPNYDSGHSWQLYSAALLEDAINGNITG